MTALLIVLILLLLGIVIYLSMRGRGARMDKYTIEDERICTIEHVYAYINKNLQATGYQDGFDNLSDDYKTHRLNENLNEGLHLCDMAIIGYKAHIRKLGNEMYFARRDALFDTAHDLAAKRDECRDHIEKIREICDMLRKMTVYRFDSYNRGFAKGNEDIITTNDQLK